MKFSVFKTVIALGLTLALLSKTGMAAEPTDIVVADSLKDTELHIAAILKEKMNVSGSLTIPGSNPDDLVLRFTVNASGDVAVPPLHVVIDAPILSRDKSGAVSSQMIGIASYADVKMVPDKHLEMLEWVNRFNSRTTPVRFYVSGDRIVVAWYLLITTKEPVTEEAFLTALKSLIQSWPGLINDMKSSGLTE
jgi:hypothetical protein